MFCADCRDGPGAHIGQAGCIDNGGGRTVERVEQGQEPVFRWPPFLVVADEITDDLDAGLGDMAADPAAQHIEMAFDPGMWFQMNAGLYGGFATSLHGKAQFHRGDNVIIG